MIDARMIRDIAFALVLAVPTLSLTRPTAAESLSPEASRSPIVANAAMASMTADVRRSTITSE